MYETDNAAEAVTSMKLGNSLWETTAFNSRLQPTQIGLGLGSATQNKLKLAYSYGTTANNGNVVSQTITVPGVAHPFVQSYSYDELNRISNAEETQNSVQTWEQTFTYDRYGNRNFDEANTTTLPKNCGSSPNFTVCTADVPKVNPAVTASTNKFTTGYTYDSSGNTTEDANEWIYIYDAENKQIEVKDDQNVTVGEYLYDGDGKRIKKYIPGTGELTIFVYDAGARLIQEHSTIVQTGNNAKTVYTTSDHLGSSRINTDVTGEVISRHDYHPFGDEVTRTGYGSDTVRKQFTGYERDGETGLDFAQARMFDYSHGRFTSPDPFGGSGIAQIPQSWNRYVYCLNRPYMFTDPSGLIWLTTDDQTFTWVDDKEYKRNPKKYENHKVANGAVIKLAGVTGVGAKYDKLVDKFVQLNKDGNIYEVPDPTMNVRMEEGEEDNTFGVSLGTLTYDPADTKDPLRGPPGGSRRFGKTIRIYNADGKPYVDVDHHTDHGAGTPHIHWWDWDNPAEPRGKAEPLPGWFGEDGIWDDGIPIHSPFARRPLAPGTAPFAPGRPFPNGVPQPAPGLQPMPVRPMVPLRPMTVPVIL